MNRHVLLSVAIVGALACDEAPAAPGDATRPGVDADAHDVAEQEVAADAASPPDASGPDAAPVDGSLAGRACEAPEGQPDLACGDADLLCFTINSRPICTNPCTNSAAQANERTRCGDALSTCLTEGEGTTATSRCVAACQPRRAAVSPGACEAGFVCTGWWYTHPAGRPDATGCHPFCSIDAHCPTGMRCNARTGACSGVGVVMTRRPDGEPCDPAQVVTDPGDERPRSAQCRGICFTTSGNLTRGLCGSQVNLRVTTSCPDDPIRMAPSGASGADDLGVCVLRGCDADADCAAPLVCRRAVDAMGQVVTGQPPSCNYPTAAQPDGGGAPRDADMGSD